MKISGIYIITNLMNNKIYIGKSENCYGRWLKHKTDYLLGNNPLYKEMREYGLKNFEFKIIEKTPAFLLKAREQEYIQKYNSKYPNGYN